MSGQALSDLERIFAGTADAVFAVDTAFTVRFANLAFHRLLKQSPDASRGRPCSEVLCGIDRDGRPFCGSHCLVAGRLRARDLVADFDLGLPRPGGHRIWVNVGALRALDEWRPVKVVFFLRPLRGPEAAFPPPGPAPVGANELTPRELQVLGLLSEGVGSRQVAECLNIGWTTVRNHIRSILAKLEVHSQVEAVAYAFRQGLVPPR